MAQGFKQLVAALQSRYDFHSAQAVAMDALDAAGLEKKASYEDKEWAKLLKAVLGEGDGLEAVWQTLGDAPKGVKIAKPAEEEEAPAEEQDATGGDAPAKKAPAKKKSAKGKKD